MQIKTYGVNLNISNDIPTKAGYIFKGWATSISGSVTYEAGNTYALDEDITLYAVWEAETYTISYDANGGTNVPGIQLKTYGVDLTIASDTPIRKGYVFKGWAMTSEGEVVYLPEDKYSEETSVTLYAIWEEESVNYGDSNNDGKIDVKDAVLLAQFLAGWDVSIDFNSADCNADGELSIKDAVLLAQYLAGWNVTLG